MLRIANVLASRRCATVRAQACGALPLSGSGRVGRVGVTDREVVLEVCLANSSARGLATRRRLRPGTSSTNSSSSAPVVENDEARETVARRSRGLTGRRTNKVIDELFSKENFDDLLKSLPPEYQSKDDVIRALQELNDEEEEDDDDEDDEEDDEEEDVDVDNIDDLKRLSQQLDNDLLLGSAQQPTSKGLGQQNRRARRAHLQSGREARLAARQVVVEESDDEEEDDDDDGDEDEEEDGEDVEEEDEDDEDDDLFDDAEPHADAAKRLLTLSRVPYRHIPPLPSWLIQKQHEVASHRTSPQIRRCLKSWMVKYDVERMNQFRVRELGWKESKSVELANTHDDKDEEEENDEDDDGHDHVFNKNKFPKKKASTANKPMVYGPEETAAYAFYHLPARFAVQKRIFEDIKTLLQQPHQSPAMATTSAAKREASMRQFTPRRVLDFGCGPGTAAAAAHAVWGANGDIQSYAGIDVSQSMLDAAKIVTRDLLPNATFWNKNADIVQRALKQHERFDLVVASYTLSELTSDAARKAATQLLFELLDVNGVLVLVEPGNPQGSHTVRTARQFLLDMMRGVDADGRFSSPHYISKLTEFQLAELKKAQKNPNPQKGKKTANKFSKSNQREQDEDDDYYEIDADEEKKLLKQALASEYMILPPPPLSIPSSSSSSSVANKFKPLKHNDFFAKVVAPCTHDRPCPLSQGSWCSFSQRVASSTLRKDAEEKFSYVVIQKLVRPNVIADSLSIANEDDLQDNGWIATTTRAPQSSDSVTALLDSIERSADANGTAEDLRHISPLHLLQVLQGPLGRRDQNLIKDMIDETDWNEYGPQYRREEYGRLVRSPLKGRGHITLDLCLPDGTLQRRVNSKSDFAQNLPRFYNAMRKTSWGGLLPSYMIPPVNHALRASKEERIAKKERKVKIEQQRVLKAERSGNLKKGAATEEMKLDQMLDQLLMTKEVTQDDIISLLQMGEDGDEMINLIKKNGVRNRNGSPELAIDPKSVREVSSNSNVTTTANKRTRSQSSKMDFNEILASSSTDVFERTSSKGTRKRTTK